MSVRAKFCPFAKIGSPEALARAYAKQSPKLSAAGWRPFPKLRQADERFSTCWGRPEPFSGFFGPPKGRTRAPPAPPVLAWTTFPLQGTWQASIEPFQAE